MHPTRVNVLLTSLVNSCGVPTESLTETLRYAFIAGIEPNLDGSSSSGNCKSTPLGMGRIGQNRILYYTKNRFLTGFLCFLALKPGYFALKNRFSYNIRVFYSKKPNIRYNPIPRRLRLGWSQ